MPFFEQLPHAGIKKLKPYVPGKSIEQLAKERGLSDIIKLASNENPLGCSPTVTEALASLSKQSISSYPAANFHPLKEKLSKYLGISPHLLTLSNGSDQLIQSLLITFALHTNKHILTHDKAFNSYQIQAETFGIPVHLSPLLPDWQLDLEALIAACTEETALIFLANPNNPTGILTPLASIEQILRSIPKTTLLVIDEAYYEYAFERGNPACLRFIEEYSNLIVTRTFSKAYGLAGLRLGYAISHPSIHGLLQRTMLPFLVSQASMLAGCIALDDEAFVQRTLANNRAGLKQLELGLTQLGFGVTPSQCNFLMVDCKQSASFLYEKLLDYGIIVRPLDAYGLLNYLRITVGTPEQNSRLLETLDLILHSEKTHDGFTSKAL